MRIRVLSVSEGVIYHCWCVDATHPERPTIELDARLLPGDADAESGPLLLSVADYIPMAGGRERAAPCLQQLASKGRLVDHLDVPHITFPTWSEVVPEAG